MKIGLKMNLSIYLICSFIIFLKLAQIWTILTQNRRILNHQ